MSQLSVDAVDKQSGSTLTLGGAGTTVQPHASATVSGFGGGKVLQVVQTVKTDTFSRASTGGDVGDITGLSVSITPSSTSSKVLVLATVHHSSANGQENWIILVRDSTNSFIADAAGSRQRTSSSGRTSNTAHQINSAITYLDSPNTTSLITYKFTGGAEGSNTIYINRSDNDTDSNTIARTASSITVMEIGA